MEKLMVRTALITVFMLSFPALSATYEACNYGGSCNTYNTNNTNPGAPSNLGAFQPGGTPGGGMGGGPSPADMAKKKEAERKGCFASVEAQFLPKCDQEVNQIYQDNLTSCNTGVAVGSAASVAGLAGLGVLALVTAPVSIPLMLVGAATFSTVAVGGAYVAANNQFQCKDQAEWTKKDNLQICQNKVADAQKVACRVYL